MKFRKLHGCVAAIGAIIFTSCTNKETTVNILTDNSSPEVVDANVQVNLRAIARKGNTTENVDSLSQDSTTLFDCYRWNRNFKGTTEMIDEEGEPFELNISITLQDSSTDDYTGGIVICVDEENFVEATVRGHAEGNHIIIYYVENVENTTGDLFKDGDKLVLFELADGEYQASWYSPMHRFVDESTVTVIDD